MKNKYFFVFTVVLILFFLYFPINHLIESNKEEIAKVENITSVERIDVQMPQVGSIVFHDGVSYQIEAQNNMEENAVTYVVTAKDEIMCQIVLKNGRFYSRKELTDQVQCDNNFYSGKSFIRIDGYSNDDVVQTNLQYETKNEVLVEIKPEQPMTLFLDGDYNKSLLVIQYYDQNYKIIIDGLYICEFRPESILWKRGGYCAFGDENNSMIIVIPGKYTHIIGWSLLK